MRSMRAIVVCVASSVAAFGVARDASAEPTSDERALALALFKRGRELIAAGEVAAACRSFQESQRLDPGGGTLLNLAVCHEREGRTATAWTEYAEALAIARRDARADRIDLANEHMSALEPRLARLAVVVPVHDPPLRVVRDGHDLPREAWSLAIPVDPGEHVVEAFAGDDRVFHERLALADDGATKTVTITIAPAESASPTAEISAPPQELPATPSATPVPSLRTVAGWSLVGGGAVLVGIGTYFGARAFAKRADSDDGCVNDVCSDRAVADNELAKSAADASTVCIVTGGAALVVGVVLLVTRPRAPSHRAWSVVPGAAGGSMITRF